MAAAPGNAGWTAVTVLLHAAATLALASLVAVLAEAPGVQDAVVAGSGDAVYGRLTLALIGNIRPRGIGSGLAVVFSSGSSVVGVQLVRLLADLALVSAGAGLLTLMRRRRWFGSTLPRALGALVWLAYGVAATFRLAWGAGSGGEMLLSMVATKVLGVSGPAYAEAAGHQAVFSLAVDTLAVVSAAGAGWSVARLALWLGSFRRRRPRPYLLERGWRTAMCAAALPALLVGGLRPAVAFERVSAGAVRLDARVSPAVDTGSNLPSVVTVERTSGGWEYRVNGERQIVHGIGYNAVTAGYTREQRATLYDRDFAAIRAAGANTLVGWTESDFDDLLMRKANEHGLGVLLPFHLGPTYVLAEPNYVYTDPAVRQQLMAAITQRVEHFRNSPALRMWGLGNEVLHALSWAHDSPANAQAFAQFLVQAADRVHQLDPNHPVIYRDAEDWYVKPLADALAANPKPRPWFIYGMNFFSMRLQTALDSGPATALHQPLLISEFGPVGLRSEARPAGYEQFWASIRAHPDVLGGSAYVWTTAGPEALDRTFGLTDAQGAPVDGSLAELAALYENDR
jgi:hypothetical protein